MLKVTLFRLSFEVVSATQLSYYLYVFIVADILPN